MEWIWKEKPKNSIQLLVEMLIGRLKLEASCIELLRFRGKVWAEDINLEVTAQTWYVKA